MEPTPDHTRAKRRELVPGIGYSLLIMSVGGYLNYITPYEPGPADDVQPWYLLFWALLYLPLLVYPIYANWRVSRFGFSVTPYTLLASVLFAMLCGSVTATQNPAWWGALTEAFARTGEELFFRGFLYLLLLEIFVNSRRPWIWAVVGSSLAFTLVHTQAFQPYYLEASPVMSPAYLAAERLFNIFLLGALFALLRHWTKSILPGSIAHSLVQSSFLALPFVLLIYAVFIGWAHLRKERVFFFS
jgi:membrane protease YdiL (CAAX protease family)